MFNPRAFVPTLFALCGFALVSARPAACDIVKLEPTADASIMSNDDGAKYNFGSDPFLLGYNDSYEKSSILLQFDIAKMEPSGIRSARLRLWSTGWTGGFENTAPTSVFAMSSPWKETEVNWYYAAEGIGWKSPGGDTVSNGVQPVAFATNTIGMTVSSESAGMIEWDVTELVRMWASRRLRNNGLRIDTSDGLFLFESRETLDKNLCPTLILDIGR